MKASSLSYRLRMPSRQEYGSAERLDGALPIQGIGLFHRQCAFPSLAPWHVRGQALLSTWASQALEKSGRPPEWQAWINFSKTSFYLILPQRGLLRGFCWSLKQECESGPQNRSTTPPPAEAKKGEKLHGVSSQACQAGHEAWEPHTELEALAYRQEAPAGSPLQPANTSCPSLASFS